jgi:glutathione S-transferase
MLTVHHLQKSRSKRVIWLLEELKMPYTVITHERDPITNLSPDSLKAIHPLGKAPIIIDGGNTLCESGAVMEYILDLSMENKLKPAKNSDRYYQYIEWLHFAEGSLSLPLITKLIMGKETRDGTKPLDHYIGKEIALDFSYIEKTLTQQTYFAGESFTAADIMMTFMLEIASSLGLLMGKEKTQNYLSNMQKRTAYQKTARYG